MLYINDLQKLFLGADKDRSNILGKYITILGNSFY